MPPVLASVLQGVSKASGVLDVPFSPKVGKGRDVPHVIVKASSSGVLNSPNRHEDRYSQAGARQR